MENTALVSAYLRREGLYPAQEADEDGIVLSADIHGRVTLQGSSLDLIDLADLLVSLALSGESQGQHWHIDDLTLLSSASALPELILMRK